MCSCIAIRVDSALTKTSRASAYMYTRAEANALLDPLPESITAALPNNGTGLNIGPFPVLCKPYTVGRDGWEPTPSTSGGCINATSDAIIETFGPITCNHTFSGSGTRVPLSDPDYLPCLIAAKPVTPQMLSTLTDAAAALAELSAVLPRMEGILRCAFVDDAFRAVVDDNCPSIDAALRGVWRYALVAAVGLTAAAFWFCACIQCAANHACTTITHLAYCIACGTEHRGHSALIGTTIMQKPAAAADDTHCHLHRLLAAVPTVPRQAARRFPGGQARRTRAAFGHRDQCTDRSHDVDDVTRRGGALRRRWRPMLPPLDTCPAAP
jgi:hypothetical protein